MHESDTGIDEAAWAAAWRGRRVLVLGASGFLGRHVAGLAGRAGAEVHAAVRDRHRAARILPRSGGVAGVHPVDLAEEREVADLLAQIRPEVVLDLAGYGVLPEERDAQTAERLNARLLGMKEDRLRFGELPTREEEMEHGPVSVARLRALCGWAPSADLEHGVARAVRALERAGTVEERTCP